MFVKLWNLLLMLALSLLFLTSCVSQKRGGNTSPNDGLQASVVVTAEPTPTTYVISTEVVTTISDGAGLPPQITCDSRYPKRNEIIVPGVSTLGLTWVENDRQFIFDHYRLYFDVSTNSLNRPNLIDDDIRFVQPSTRGASFYAFFKDSVQRIAPESGSIVDANFDSVVESVSEFDWILDNERAVMVGFDKNGEDVSAIFDIQSNMDQYALPFTIRGAVASQDHVVGLRMHSLGNNNGDVFSLFVLDLKSMAAHEISVGDCTSFPSISVHGEIVFTGIRDIYPSGVDAEDSFFDDQPDLYIVDADSIDSENVAFRKITDDAAWESAPMWSPDGESIAFFASQQVEGQPRVQVCVISGIDEDWSGRFCRNIDGIDTDWLSLWVGRPTWSSDGLLVAVDIKYSINLDESEFGEALLLYDVANNDISYHGYDAATFID